MEGPKKKALLNLLKSRHERCEGAVTVDDVRDTIRRPKADNIIEVNINKYPSYKYFLSILFFVVFHVEFNKEWRRYQSN